MKCIARILKEFKTKKADVMWPESYHGPTDVGTLEVCGGDVTVKVRAIDEPYFGGASAKMELEATCSRCKHPYFPGRIALEDKLHLDWDITELLEKQNV